MTFLVDFGIKSALALGVAFLIAFALRRGSASMRYAMWTCALAAVLVLPVASLVGPRWNIDRGAAGPRPVNATSAAPDFSVVVHGQRPASPRMPVVLIIWIAGVMGMLARIASGHWRVRSLFGKADRIHDPLAEETAAHLGFRRPVILKCSTATDVPLSYGLFRATVLLPGESEHWTEERRRIVLSHEMIHARRLDSLWGLLANCSLAANWINPLAWLAIRQFRIEQERSCDDAVVLAGTASTLYAAHLVDLARSIAIAEPALGMAERFDLEGRVHALLDPARRRSGANSRACVAMFVAALALTVPLAAVRAQSTSKPAAGDTNFTASSSPSAPRKNSEDAPAGPARQIALNKPARRASAQAEEAPSPEPQTAVPSSLAGSVYDPSGAVIPRATILLKSTSSSNEEAALADEAGSYKLKGILAGEYLLTVRAPGFATYQKTLSLEAGASATVDLHLAIGEGDESLYITALREAGAAPQNSAPQRIRVGGMVQAFNLIRKVTPMYPPDARQEGVEGTVLLRAIISKVGTLLSIVPVNSTVDPRLVSAAVGAVSQWQYQPTLLNNEPVEVITTIAVSFRLK